MAGGTNNPFNIRHNPNNQWEGQIGQTGGFADFKTLRHGIRAGDITMENYGELHGINTLEGAISRWAPPSDRNPTRNYIDFVSSRTGITPNQQLDLNDPRLRANVLSAMADFENEGNNNVAADAIRQSRTSVPVEDSPQSVDRTDQAITDFISRPEQRREYASRPEQRREYASTQAAARSTQVVSRPPQAVSRRARLSESELGQQLNFGGAAAYREEVLSEPGVINIPEPNEPLVVAPGSLRESFRRGAGAGLQGLRADLNYLRAIGNLFIGDEEGAVEAVERAAMNKEQAAEITAGSETFEEFIDEPTFSGFMHQASQTIGQVTPFFVETFAGMLMGGTGGLFVKAGINVAQKQTAKKLLKDLVTKKSKSKAEQELLQDLYTVARRNYFEGAGKYAKRGMMGGAFAAEYPVMTGEHFGEFDEAGVDLNISRALQAMGMGAPSAFIGAAGEVMILNRIGRNFAKVATKTAAGETSGLLATLAKNVGKGAGQQAFTEGLTETLQEGLLVGQRVATDENYAREEILMRLGHSAFAGALAGSFTGGTGGVLTTIPDVLRSGQQTAANVKPKVAAMIGAARQQQVDTAVDAEKYGTNRYTSAPEATRDLNAQLQAVIDGIKPSAFHEGRNFHELTPNIITPITDESGQSDLFGLYIKDRGTLYSTDPLLLETFQRNFSDTPGNTEALLAAALGYSAEIPDNADTIIQVKNVKTGEIISEQLTSSYEQDPVAHDAAVAAANVFINKGREQGVHLEGKRISLDEALVERKQRVDAEEVVVRGMNIVGSADTLGLPIDDAEAADLRVLDIELTKIIESRSYTQLDSSEGEFTAEAIENAKRVRAIVQEHLARYDEGLAEKNKGTG